MSYEDLWETSPEEDERDAWSQPGGRAAHGNGARPAQLTVPSRGRRVLWVSIAFAAAALVAAAGTWLAAPKPLSATLLPVPAQALKGIQSQSQGDVQGQGQTPGQSPGTTAQQSTGATGQVVGMGGLCLAGSTADNSGGTPVILTTCTGTGTQQDWTLQENEEIVLNGRCLGVNPESAKSASLVGLYACNMAASELWQVQNGTIRSLSSGLCLGSWKDAGVNGSPVGVAGCQPNAEAQDWTVPSYAVDPSGLAMPVGNIPGWKQVFTDNFTENVPVGEFPAEVSSKWGDYLDGWLDTTHHGTYEPTQVVSIHNGIMDLYLHTVNGVHMVAAPYPKIPGAPGSEGGMRYGMYEVRFKAQQVKGYKTAWLLWPDNENPVDGEIDFPEGDLQKNILAFLHHADSNPKDQESYSVSDTYADWHTATTIWTSDAIIFMLDGKVIGDTTNKSIIPNVPMHWVLQTETRTGGGPPSDTATANVDIDWVSVWAPQAS